MNAPNNQSCTPVENLCRREFMAVGIVMAMARSTYATPAVPAPFQRPYFDTAEVYGPFVNEELLGKALAPFKGKVVIGSKFGFDIDENGRNCSEMDNGAVVTNEETKKRFAVGSMHTFPKGATVNQALMHTVSRDYLVCSAADIIAHSIEWLLHRPRAAQVLLPHGRSDHQYGNSNDGEPQRKLPCR